jgi:hypothetical protein
VWTVKGDDEWQPHECRGQGAHVKAEKGVKVKQIEAGLRAILGHHFDLTNDRCSRLRGRHLDLKNPPTHKCARSPGVGLHSENQMQLVIRLHMRSKVNKVGFETSIGERVYDNPYPHAPGTSRIHAASGHGQASLDWVAAVDRERQRDNGEAENISMSGRRAKNDRRSAEYSVDRSISVSFCSPASRDRLIYLTGTTGPMAKISVHSAKLKTPSRTGRAHQ